MFSCSLDVPVSSVIESITIYWTFQKKFILIGIWMHNSNQDLAISLLMELL